MSKKTLVLLLIILASFALLYRQVIAVLVDDWVRDGNNSHGFLIVPLALFFAWERRREFAETAQRPSAAGILLVVAGIIVTMLNMHPFVNRLAMLVSISGALVFLCGWARLKVMAFPVAFLLLMFPIPAIIFNQIAFPLQLVASRFGEWTLTACQVPVLREGNVIHLANTSLEVAEACSGIRSLISLLTLGIVYGYFVESRIWGRIALALATVPVAIAANAFRVAGTGLAAHLYGPEAAEGFFHSFSGWLVFIVAFAMLFVLHRLLVLIAPANMTASDVSSPSKANVEGSKSSKNLERSLKGSRIMAARVLALSACFLAGAGFMARGRGPAVILPRDSLSTLPMQIGAWRGREGPDLSQAARDMLHLDDYANRFYITPDGAIVSLYIGYHTAGGFHSPMNCLPGSGWSPVRKSYVDIEVPMMPSRAGGGSPLIHVNRIVILKGLDKQVVLYWYQGCGRVTASEYWGLIFGMVDKMRLGRTDAALVRIVSPAESLEPAAEEKAGARAVQFAQVLFPLLNRYIPD